MVMVFAVSKGKENSNGYKCISDVTNDEINGRQLLIAQTNQ